MQQPRKGPLSTSFREASGHSGELAHYDTHLRDIVLQEGLHTGGLCPLLSLTVTYRREHMA